MTTTAAVDADDPPDELAAASLGELLLVLGELLLALLLALLLDREVDRRPASAGLPLVRFSSERGDVGVISRDLGSGARRRAGGSGAGWSTGSTAILCERMRGGLGRRRQTAGVGRMPRPRLRPERRVRLSLKSPNRFEESFSDDLPYAPEPDHPASTPAASPPKRRFRARYRHRSRRPEDLPARASRPRSGTAVPRRQRDGRHPDSRHAIPRPRRSSCTPAMRSPRAGASSTSSCSVR